MSAFRPPPSWPPPPPGWQPGPGWQPDPSWPPPPPGWEFWGPPPKRRLWLVIGLPVTLGVLLLAGLISVVVYGATHTASRARNAASSYAQALQDKRYAAAYDMLCRQDQLGQASFVRTQTSAETRGRNIADFTITDVAVSNVNGRSSAEAEISVRFADGTTRSDSLYLVKSGGTWKPCP